MLLLRLIYVILLPLLVLGRVWAVLRGRESWGDLWTRLRGPAVPPGAIWVHGASVGEVASAKPIIEALSDRPLLVTVNTTTGRDRVASWGMAHVTATLAPLDFAHVARRKTAQASALIVLENELWPMRMLAAHAADLPVVMLGARMSDRSARAWGRFAGVAADMLGPVDLVVPQDAGSARNLVALGVSSDRMLAPVTLKAAYVAKTRELPAEAQEFDRKRTVLAAATHAGEEEIVLDAFRTALETRPDLRLILAPRHPERGAALCDLIAAKGFTATQRSASQEPAQIYLADTLGEMPFWYRVAGVVFVGGSLVDKGGHTPFEPIAYGCPLLHGPSVRNFADIYGPLDAGNGAVAVAGSDDLASAMIAHLGDDAMAKRASEIGAPVDLAPLIAQIKATLPAPPTR